MRKGWIFDSQRKGNWVLWNYFVSVYKVHISYEREKKRAHNWDLVVKLNIELSKSLLG
jgi:hypothetical protein